MISYSFDYKYIRFIRKVFFVWCVFLAEGHILLASFRYIIDFSKYIPILQWAGLGLLIVAFIGLCVSLFLSKQSRAQTLHLLKQMLSFEQFLLFFMVGWFMLSLYINGKLINNYVVHLLFEHESWYLFDMAVCFLVLFAVPKVFGLDKAGEFIKIIIHITVVIYTVFTIICLWHIFHLKVLDFPSGEQGGITAQYQLVLGKHYNLTGMISATMFCMCIYMIATSDRWIKLFYLVFASVHLLVIYLSNCRTVFVGILVFTATIGFAFPWKHFKSWALWKRLLASISISMVSIAMLWIGRSVAFSLFEGITHFKDVLAMEESDLSVYSRHYFSTPLAFHQTREAYVELLVNNVKEDIRQLDSLSNREYIWRAALRVLGHDSFTTFFGVTPLRVTNSLKDIGYYTSEAAHAHNSILQVGISMGIPAMGMLIAFLFSLAWHCIHIIFIKVDNASDGLIILVSSVFCFVIINMAEAYLIAYFSVIACSFFLFAGYIISADASTGVSFPSRKRLILPFFSIGVSVILCIAITTYSVNYLNINSRKLSGSGTSQNPYLIEDATDLRYFRDMVNRGYAFTNQFVTQNSNIDLEGKEWSSIGITGTQNRFEGIYNGSYHSISNLKIPKYSALFGNLKGTVLNLTVLNGIIGEKPFGYDPEASQNLLRGTNKGTKNYSLGQKGYNAKLEADDDGVKVTTKTNEGEQKWLVLFYYDGNSMNVLSGSSEEKYTISFEAKANVKDAEIKVSHREGDGRANQIDFGTATLKNANEWTQVILTGKLEGVEAANQGVYLDLKENPAGTEIAIRNLKLEKGDSASPWAPAAVDVIAATGDVIG